MQITKEYRFEAAHRLETHEGKCARLHGHSYRFEVEFEGELQEETGMVIDYGDISRTCKELVDMLDHKFLVAENNKGSPLFRALRANEEVHLLGFQSSTAENIAQFIAKYLNLAQGLPVGVVLSRVTVWETATSSATWQRHLTNPEA